MPRTLFALAIVALAVLTTGCTMCADPYDYCGPTFTGQDCRQCMPNARSGSILAAGAPVAAGPEAVPDEEVVPLPDAQPVQVPQGYGGMVLPTPGGRAVVRPVAEGPAERAAAAQTPARAR